MEDTKEKRSTEGPIVCRVHLRSSVEAVLHLLMTDEGRERFWVERSRQRGSVIELSFPNGENLEASVVEPAEAATFAMTYFGASLVRFDVRAVADGTDVAVEESGVPPEQWAENRAGWVSVLMNLKSVADHGIDLRNHEAGRTWSEGYVDN